MAYIPGARSAAEEAQHLKDAMAVQHMTEVPEIEVPAVTLAQLLDKRREERGVTLSATAQHARGHAHTRFLALTDGYGDVTQPKRRLVVQIRSNWATTCSRGFTRPGGTNRSTRPS